VSRSLLKQTTRRSVQVQSAHDRSWGQSVANCVPLHDLEYRLISVPAVEVLRDHCRSPRSYDATKSSGPMRPTTFLRGLEYHRRFHIGSYGTVPSSQCRSRRVVSSLHRKFPLIRIARYHLDQGRAIGRSGRQTVRRRLSVWPVLECHIQVQNEVLSRTQGSQCVARMRDRPRLNLRPRGRPGSLPTMIGSQHHAPNA
jgi:hypothetical protein